MGGFDFGGGGPRLGRPGEFQLRLDPEIEARMPRYAEQRAERVLTE